MQKVEQPANLTCLFQKYVCDKSVTENNLSEKVRSKFLEHDIKHLNYAKLYMDGTN